MDPLDHLVALPHGLRCSVCDERVPVTRIRVLAYRDDLTFLEIDCDACGSATLGFVLDGRAEEPVPAHVGEPVTADDVLDMHELLSGWHGDVVGLLAHERDGGGPAGGSGAGRAR